MGPFLVFFRASRYNNFWEFTINKDVYKQSMCRGMVDGVSMDGLSDESAHGSLMDVVQPMMSARYVKMTSSLRPN